MSPLRGRSLSKREGSHGVANVIYRQAPLFFGEGPGVKL